MGYNSRMNFVRFIAKMLFGRKVVKQVFDDQQHPRSRVNFITKKSMKKNSKLIPKDIDPVTGRPYPQFAED